MSAPGRKRLWVFRILTVALTLALLELVALVAVRLAIPGPFRPVGDDLLALDPAFGFAGFRFEDADQVLAGERDPDTFRILSFGASTTAGWPYGVDLSYGRFLAEILREGWPERRFEVLNLGVPGLDSREVRGLVENALDVEPDLVLVYTSHNTVEEYTLKKERLGAFWPGWSLIEGTSVHRLLNHLVNRLVTSRAEWTVVPGDTRGRIFPAPVLPPSAKRRLVGNYARNVEAIVDATRAAGAHLLLLEPIYRHGSYGPVQSVTSPSTDGATRRALEEALAEGAALDRTGRPEEAARIVRETLVSDPDVAAGHYLLARSLARIGRVDEALAHRERSAELDGLWAVCPPSFRKRLRRIAETRGVPLLRLGEEIATRTGDRFLDGDWFVDDIHPTPSAHRRIADLIAERIEAEGWLPPPPGGRTMPDGPEIDLRRHFGARRYAAWLRELGVHLFHLSFLSFDPVPILDDSRARLAEHLAAVEALGERSFEGEVYSFAAAAEAGEEPDVQPLVRRWGRPALDRILASGHNRYGALDSLAAALGPLDPGPRGSSNIDP